MKGFITDSELGQADQVFPGIAAFFESLLDKPGTFLELVGQFQHWGERSQARPRDQLESRPTAVVR